MCLLPILEFSFSKTAVSLVLKIESTIKRSNSVLMQHKSICTHCTHCAHRGVAREQILAYERAKKYALSYYQSNVATKTKNKMFGIISHPPHLRSPPYPQQQKHKWRWRVVYFIEGGTNV